MKVLETLKEMTLKDVGWLVVVVIVVSAALPRLLDIGSGLLALISHAVGGK